MRFIIATLFLCSCSAPTKVQPERQLTVTIAQQGAVQTLSTPPITVTCSMSGEEHKPPSILGSSLDLVGAVLGLLKGP